MQVSVYRGRTDLSGNGCSLIISVGIMNTCYKPTGVLHILRTLQGILRWKKMDYGTVCGEI